MSFKSQEIKQYFNVGNVEVELISDIDKGQLLDTSVYINNDCICWISGNDIADFKKEFQDLIKKYQI